MKVLWFSNTPANGAVYLKKGSLGGGWLRTLDVLIQESVDLHIAFINPRGPCFFQYKNSKYYSISPKNWKFRVFLNLFFGISTERKYDINLYLDLISEIKPDLIHIHGTESDFIEILNRSNIPILVSIQGNVTVLNHKFFSGIEKKYFSNSFFDSFRNFKGIFKLSIRNKKRDIELMAARESRQMKYFQFVAGRTDWDKFITRILSPKSTYFHVDEILRDPFYEHTWTANQSFNIHTTTGPNVFKGIETVCFALTLLQRINIKISWSIAGIDENSHYVIAIRKKLKFDFPSEGLYFLGKLDEKELLSKMLSSALYVMPSHIENSSNSLCEAMLIGMPCIATFAGGTGSLLENGSEGIFVQDGDPWALAGAVLSLLTNRELAFKFGRNARARALLRHDKISINRQVLSAYSDILNNR
jgi:glycosyltransferase involved in cell wall biosynthesis